MDLATNEAHERWRASARDTLGRVMKGYSKPWAAPELPEGTINLSDPDSRLMRTQGTPPSHEGRLPRSASLSLPVCGRQETRGAASAGPSSCSRVDAR